MGGSEAELQDLTTRLEKASGAVGMKVSSEYSKILVNSRSQQAATSIVLNGQLIIIIIIMNIYAHTSP